MKDYDRKKIQADIKRVFRSQANLARLLGGVGRSGISQWFSDSRNGIPAEYCSRIAELSGGHLSVHDLRPDIFPAPAQNQDAA